MPSNNTHLNDSYRFFFSWVPLCLKNIIIFEHGWSHPYIMRASVSILRYTPVRKKSKYASINSGNIAKRPCNLTGWTHFWSESDTMNFVRNRICTEKLQTIISLTFNHSKQKLLWFFSKNKTLKSFLWLLWALLIPK